MSLSPSGGAREDGLLMQIPGLLVEVLAPPAHYLPNAKTAAQPVVIRANVTMMCGCPIQGDGPWPPADFGVTAHIDHNGRMTTVPLAFLDPAVVGAPSQFASSPWSPGAPGIYAIDVVAYQVSTGNLGVGRTSIIIPKS